MVDVMSVHEYTLALTETRAAQSKIIAVERDAARRALARLQTSQGRVETRRRANTAAARLLRTAVEAERIARLAALRSASIEPEELGRERLIAATAEVFGIRPDQVKHHRDKPVPREPAPPKVEGPKRNRGRPRTTEHGYWMYRSGACRCDEICRPANAAHKREYRAKVKARKLAQA